MTYNIINSGSDGNCTIINDIIAIDLGVSYKKLAPYVKQLEIVFLTHEHGDHFNKKTIKRLAKERPMLRFGCCEWLLDKLLELEIDRKRIDGTRIAICDFMVGDETGIIKIQSKTQTSLSTK